MPIRFACPCGKALTAADAHAGRSVRCPRCQAVQAVPSAAAAAAGPILLPDEPPGRAASPGLLLAVAGGMLLLIGGGVTAVYLWNRDGDEPARGGGGTSPAPQNNPVAKVREAAARTTVSNNFKQIGIAIHAYESDHGFLPPPVIQEPGRPPRSWRVEVLPYLEQNDLHQRWRMDLPYDSPENRALWGRMPPQYGLPGEAGHLTHYQRFVELGAPPRRWTLGMLSNGDGASNTIAVALAAEPVVWCAPQDLGYSRQEGGFPAARLRWLGSGGQTPVLMFDGATRFVRPSIRPQTLLAAITPDGGEVLGPDFDD